MVKCRNLYENYKDKKIKIPHEQVEELKEYLDITNDKQKIAHTLTLFDDCTNLFSKSKNLLADMIFRNRHMK
jgi:hypothetical protein